MLYLCAHGPEKSTWQVVKCSLMLGCIGSSPMSIYKKIHSRYNVETNPYFK